ncbi:MAG TPA: hypothetical protein PKJ25_07525 [Smithellaceae bacterium]|nr:hypothetical protein [Smithellaceae bacterium]
MKPTIIIQFAPKTWKPTIFINANTDFETAIIKKVVDNIWVALDVSEEFENCAVAIEEEDSNRHLRS